MSQNEFIFFREPSMDEHRIKRDDEGSGKGNQCLIN